MKIVKYGKISKDDMKEIKARIDMNLINNEEEQTIVIGKTIYEVNSDLEDQEIYVKSYTFEQYADKYGEGTLLDLIE